MAILEQWMDEWTKTQITEAFIRDFGSDEDKAQARTLLDAQDWAALDALMAPYHNI